MFVCLSRWSCNWREIWNLNLIWSWRPVQWLVYPACLGSERLLFKSELMCRVGASTMSQGAPVNSKWYISVVSHFSSCAAHIDYFQYSVTVLQQSNRWTFRGSRAFFINIVGHRQSWLCGRLLMKWVIFEFRGVDRGLLAGILFGGWGLAREV